MDSAGPQHPSAGHDHTRSLLRPMRRADLVALADRLLTGIRATASPGHARLCPPGPPGPLGADIDTLEGFARSFLLAGFRVAGGRGADPDGLLDFYAQGLDAGTDPRSPERWPTLPEHGQTRVEAASLALILDLTRPWLWDQLDTRVQRQLVNYLSPSAEVDYADNNWRWFRIVTQTFLRSVDGPHSDQLIRDELAALDQWLREDGWLLDGHGRNIDHYIGWAMHLYPALWARMQAADDLAAPRRERYRELLDRYLVDAVRLVGADGGPLIQGRSLIYRFAAAAPFWVGALEQVPSTPLGQLRDTATAMVRHFVDRGVANDLLSVGWFEPSRLLAQFYSGPGSPYWASKGLLGIALPEDHPVWSAPSTLVVPAKDEVIAIQTPGWLVQRTADALVRVVNHGVDHANPPTPGDDVALADSPLYARLGYSPHTAPLMGAADWANPADNAVVVVGADGRHSHRTGMALLGTQVTDGVGVAGSTGAVRWMQPDPVVQDAGHPRPGSATAAGRLTTVSIVHGDWEVRVFRLTDPSPQASGVTVFGWPSHDLVTRVVPLLADQPTTSGHTAHRGTSALADEVSVPHVEFGLSTQWQAAGVLLSTTDHPAPTVSLSGTTLQLHWPDDTLSVHPLT